MALAGPLVFAGKSVAAAVVKEIITKAFKYLDGYFSAETMEEMKTKLEYGMMQIQAVLDIVSPDHIEGEIESLDQWFWKFRDAVEEAEDAVDELKYYELEEKAKDHQVSDWGSPFAKAKHKVITSVKHVSVLDKTVKQFTHRGTLKRLKKAVDGLDKAVGGATKFLEVVKYLKGAASSRSGQQDFLSSDRQTGSTSTVTKFVGRGKEKKQILEWLTKRTTVDEEAEVVSSIVPIPIFSLVGHGGMGKTTLAQTICEQGEVVKHFKIIWVTVSTSFNATVVTRKILESIDKKIPKADSLEPMQQILKDNLKSFDKFLLIFDDVWEENKRDEWEKLFAPLRMGSIGSKILLTTRNASVAAMAANMMKVARAGLTLKELHEDDSLELFSHHVFSGMNSQDYSDLKVIGEQIARKLGGCPLVTKVVGGHLQRNMTFEIWEKFLLEELEDFKGNSDDIMKVLRLSYYYLPTELQVCFRYCSIFPQDYKFTKEELVLSWIGSGLISTRENEEKRLEEIGETYLFQLTMRSFFDKEIWKSNKDSDGEERYIMHDLMHELAGYVSFGECKRITSSDKLTDVKDTIRHLLIKDLNGPNVDNLQKLVHFKNLRTLIISARFSKHMEGTVGNILENSRSLRLIQIDYDFKNNWIYNASPFNFPRKTSNLKHLRSVLANKLAPESIHVIHKLYHLMVLEVKHDLQIDTKKLRNMGSLDRLQYLSYRAFGQFPISRLTSLQMLNDYKVQGSKGNKISDIGNLKYLHELEVRDLQNVDNSDEARNANLKEKKYLKSLSLQWSESSSHTQNRIDDLVLDPLEPHANIKKLSIHYYEGLRLPFWMDYDNRTTKRLVSLELKRCINWEQLPCLGEFVLLRHLTLNRLPKL
ncbi:hypothetical protein EJB05_02773, partial [Eragrostis curvula]